MSNKSGIFLKREKEINQNSWLKALLKHHKHALKIYFSKVH